MYRNIIWHHQKVLLNSFYLNGHIEGFWLTDSNVQATLYNITTQESVAE